MASARGGSIEVLALANQDVLQGGPEQDAASNIKDQVRKKMWM